MSVVVVLNMSHDGVQYTSSSDLYISVEVSVTKIKIESRDQTLIKRSKPFWEPITESRWPAKTTIYDTKTTSLSFEPL